jgi:hypothetical protein
MGAEKTSIAPAEPCKLSNRKEPVSICGLAKRLLLVLLVL